MPDRRCQHQSSSYVPQLLTTHWRLSVFYVQRNSNFFVLQLYYNIANSLGAQFFANKKQINNTCTWHISASTTGECSACKRCDLQPSYPKDLGSSSGYGTVSQLQLSCKKRGYSGVTGALAKALTLSKWKRSKHQCDFPVHCPIISSSMHLLKLLLYLVQSKDFIKCQHETLKTQLTWMLPAFTVHSFTILCDYYSV